MIQLNTTLLPSPSQSNITSTESTNDDGKTGTAAASTASSSIVSISRQGYSLQQAQATAAAPTDTSAPKVKKFKPTDGKGNVSLSANITVTFTETIKRGSGNIVLKKADGTVVETFNAASSSNLSIRGKTLTINPSQNFELGTKYLVTFETGTVTDQAGNAYAGSSNYDFKTKPDKKAPKALSFNPRDGANGISPSTNIIVTFSEAIKAGNGSIILKNAKGKVVQTFRASSAMISGNTLTLDPSAKLDLNSKYTVTFSRGSVKDLAGNSYKGTKSYDFKTAPTDIPYTPPSSSSGGSTPGPYSYSDNPQDAGAFNIALNYTGDQAYLTYFQQARSFWENVITADLPDSSGIDDLRISATINSIDGVGGVLGSAGPTTLRGGSNLPITGTMQFDSADMSNMVANGTLLRVIMHEMGHVLGIGSLWSTFGYNSTPGQYTGTNALAAYAAIVGGNPAYVPLEDGGGAGTYNVHWEEDVFTSELMTGYATGSMLLSTVTIGALEDLGYTVDYGAAETAGLNLMAPAGAPGPTIDTLI